MGTSLMFIKCHVLLRAGDRLIMVPEKRYRALADMRLHGLKHPDGIRRRSRHNRRDKRCDRAGRGHSTSFGCIPACSAEEPLFSAAHHIDSCGSDSYERFAKAAPACHRPSRARDPPVTANGIPDPLTTNSRLGLQRLFEPIDDDPLNRLDRLLILLDRSLSQPSRTAERCSPIAPPMGWSA